MTTDLKSLFAEYRDLVYAEIEGKKDPARLVEKSNLQWSKKIAPCIKHIIKNLPPKSLKVNFNKLIIMLVTYFQFKGLDFNDAWANVEPFIINYSYSATYDTPEKRKKHWADQWNYLQNDQKYSFGCKFILGLGFPGTAFDCSTCFLKEKVPSAGSFLTNINIDDIRAGRFLNTEPDSIKWLLVDSFVIGTLGLLVSNGGVGKSFFLLMLAISIAAGIPFMDDLYKIGAHGAVLVVFGEDPEVVIHRRLRNIVHAMYPPEQSFEMLKRITNSLNKNLFIISSCGEDTRLIKNDKGNPESSSLYDDLLKKAAEIDNLKLIILDPFSRFYSGNEIDAVAQTFFASLLERLARDTGASVIISQHTNKMAGINKGKEWLIQEAIRGATGLTNAARWQLNLSPMTKTEIKDIDGDPASEFDYIVGRVTKKNIGRPEDYFYLKRGDHGVLKRLTPAEGSIENLDNLVLEEIKRELVDLENADLFKTRRNFSELYAKVFHGYGRTKLEKIIDQGIKEEKLFINVRKNKSGRKTEYLSTTPEESKKNLNNLVLEDIKRELVDLENAGLFKTRRKFSEAYAGVFHGYGRAKLERLIDEGIKENMLFINEGKNESGKKTMYLASTPF